MRLKGNSCIYFEYGLFIKLNDKNKNLKT